MKRNRLFAALLGAALMLGVLTGCASGSDRVRIGTAGSGGTYYAYGTVLSQIFAGDGETSYEVKDTAGSAANLRLLSDGYLELAIAQSDVTDEAYSGTGIFAENPRTGYSAVASLYTEPCQIVVRADSDIHSVEQLLGKRVSVGEKESGVAYSARSILECCGLSFEMIDAQQGLTYAEAALALENGEIDAFFCTAGAPTNAVMNLARETPIRLLSLDEDQMNRLLQTYPFSIPTVVPADTYPGQTADTTTVGVRALLLASDKLSEDAVYDMVTAIYANGDTIRMGTPANTELAPADWKVGVTVPIHPGSQRYFDEQDIPGEVG